MTQGTIQNREAFLDKLAGKLGRERIVAEVLRPSWKFQPQYDVFKNATQDELLEALEEQCPKIHTKLVKTSMVDLYSTLKEVVEGFGGGPIVHWKDERFSEYGLERLLKKDWPDAGFDVYEWDYQLGEGNISKAEQANIGLTISDVTLAESGTVVLFSNRDKGRTISFLPTTYICLIPKSTIVPRMTQAAKVMREKGEGISSCVNFITGPSNSADIEMNLVVGVHGPVHAAYIVIEDK
jgi:L-lactate dehydrogenase complex protein LldG